jgi:hypothetical protein
MRGRGGVHTQLCEEYASGQLLEWDGAMLALRLPSS